MMKLVGFSLWTICACIHTTNAFLSPRYVSHCHRVVDRTTAASEVSSSVRLWTRPEPLGTEGDWTAYLDEETTGLVYYFNGRTGESLWEPPTKTFPVVVLPRQMRRKAEGKRSDYIKSLQDREAQQIFPLANTARNEEEALELQQQQEQQAQNGGKEGKDGEWFDFLFEEEEKEPEPSWFQSVSNVFSGADMNGKGTTNGSTDTNGEAEWQEEEGGEEQEAEDTPAEPASQEAEKKPGLFQRLNGINGLNGMNGANGGGGGGEVATEEEPPVQKRGLFDRLVSPNGGGGGGGGGVAEAIEEETSETVVAEKKTPVFARRSITFPVAAGPETLLEQEVEVAPVEVEAPIKIEAASCVLPHPAKMFWGGEDAVFTAGRTFGVFDGVTGASKQDGVPLYSKTLASEMRKAAKQAVATTTTAANGAAATNGADAGWSVLDLQKSLTAAKDVADQSSTGASTAIVASITEDGFLRALNLGDSACLVIRNGKVAARTREISHYFDCPYQLSSDSPDKPRDGTKLNIELVRGDVIVMGSDGVFDNLEDQDILTLVTDSQKDTKRNNKLSTLAKRIADRSRKVSLNRQAATPYAKQAKRNGDPDFAEGVGGKIDDVSCVVVRYA